MANTIFHCRLEIITPIHVGNGDVFRRGFDFDVRNRQIVCFDMHRIHARLAQAGPSAIKTYEEMLQEDRPSIREFFKRVGWHEDDFLLYRSRVSTQYIRDIKKHVKTGLGQPIIPGSSLKGALRTAMLLDYIDEHPEAQERLFNLRIPGKREQASRRIMQEVFGDNPNEDLMRQVIVSDVPFKDEALSLLEMKVANLTHHGYGYLNMFKKRNEHPDNWKEATSIVAEVLASGKNSDMFTISFDGFLERYQQEAFKEKTMALKRNFLSAVDYHFKKLADEELQFFKENGLEKTAQFYLQHIVEREFGESEVLIRVGWGGGWRFMTGDWVTDQQLAQIRREYRLTRGNHPVFPKSRRLAVHDNFPQIPLGWAILHLEG